MFLSISKDETSDKKKTPPIKADEYLKVEEII